MNACACPPQERDFLSSWRATAVLWRIPETAFVIAFFLPSPLRIWTWVIALAWAGTSCVANALRCRRLHCYLTGPFFVLGAVALVLYQVLAARLPASTPIWIAAAEAAGAIVLIFVPELLWGRYAPTPATSGA